MGIQAGDKAPDFSLQDQTGQVVSLQEFRGKKAVVLYFYPKDDTPGCTTEACSFRDDYEDFSKAGAEVVGVSADDPESHLRFANKYRLPFRLVSDLENRVRQAYGVSSTLGLLPGRVTFVIDKNGVVLHVFSSQFRPKKHVEEALEILKEVHGG